MRFSKLASTVAIMLFALTWGISESFANPTFYSTTDPIGHWYVSTAVNPSGDGQLSSFTTANFAQAVSVSGRPGYLADTSSGTHGGIGTWTFFVFRQTFDLSGYDATTAQLLFQWAADDSGQVYWDRGSWTPKFSLNGGAFVAYPGSPTDTYGYSSTVNLDSGFVSGLNTIDFYVEGNGVTDGFALRTENFTAQPQEVNAPVPEPSTFILLGAGLAGLPLLRRKKRV